VPNYQSAESVPGSLCEVTGVALREDCGWDLDVDELRSTLRPNTRLVSVNFPNNPTGKIVDAGTFDAIVELCRERNIWLFSDEVYRGIERDDRKRLPQAADLYERALSLNVVSKAYGLPCLRVGWIACRDPDVLERMERIKHYLSICNAGPSEALATIALKARAEILKRNRDLAAENLIKLAAFFERHRDRFEWSEPDGGCIGFPRYLGVEGVETFCARLVEEAGVLLLPASMYRSELLPVPRDRFRIGYGRRGMGEALAAFEAFLA
jgi:aspartate/methionine/tyrosine aminotransferase